MPAFDLTAAEWVEIVTEGGSNPQMIVVSMGEAMASINAPTATSRTIRLGAGSGVGISDGRILTVPAGNSVWIRPVGPRVLGYVGRESMPIPSIFNLKPSNTARARAGMAAAANGERNCLVGVFGPSTTAGQSTGGGLTQAVNAWPMQLADQLQSSGINAGANNIFSDKGSWGQAQTIANFLTGDGRVSATGAMGLGGTKAFGGNAFSVTAAGSLLFTPQKPVTKFEIVWRDNAAGRSFNVAIDGGATTLIATGGVAAIRRTVVAATALDIHTIVASWVAAGVTIIGVHAYDDTNGRKEISILNGGISGAQSLRFNDDTDIAAGFTATLAAFPFDFAIYDDAPINDWRNGVAVATSKANALAWVQKVKDAAIDPILTTPLWDNGTGSLSAQQDSYAAMLFEVATEKDVPLIDIRAAWGSYVSANARGWYSDSVHPTSAGYAAKAAMMRSALAQIKAVG